MKISLRPWLLLVSLSTTFADDNPELPLCPTSPQFFPQKLPMHCKMPVKVDQPFPNLPQYPTLPPLPESYFQSESPDKLPPPVPIPIPPFPGPMPGPMPGMVGPMPGMVGPMPGMVGPMPGMPGPMPMPMVGPPPHKLPVIVMPFYSQDRNAMKKQRTSKPKHGKKKRKRPRKKFYHSHTDSDTDTDSDSDSSDDSDDDSRNSGEHGFWKGRKSGRRMAKKFGKQHKNRKKELRKNKNLLTPILQYVTKDGYVIFEKQISKNEAKDWLKPKTEMNGGEVKDEQKPEENPEANPRPEDHNQEYENHFNPKSAEEFFKADEEHQRRIARKLGKEEAENEEAAKIEKKQHGHVKLDPFVNNSNELPQR